MFNKITKHHKTTAFYSKILNSASVFFDPLCGQTEAEFSMASRTWAHRAADLTLTEQYMNNANSTAQSVNQYTTAHSSRISQRNIGYAEG